MEIADQIIQSALEVGQKKYPEVLKDPIQKDDFDFNAVFDVDDYLYFYGEQLTDERTEAEVGALVRLLELDYTQENPRSCLWVRQAHKPAGNFGAFHDWH